MNKKIGFLGLAGIALVTACSTTATGAVLPTITPSAAPAPANPRPVFAKTGATYSQFDGTAVQRDVYQDKFLCGTAGRTQEQVCVYTFATAARQQADITQPGSGDGEVTVEGSLWDIWVIPATDEDGNFTFPVTPQRIASLTGGKVADG